MNTTHKNLVNSLVSATLISGGLALSQSSLAAEYYVAPWGADTNAGSITKPFKNIARSLAFVKPGDTVFVRAGTYVEKLSWNRSGTAAAPIKLKAYPNENPVIDGQFKLAGNWSSMINIPASYVHIEGLEVKNGLGQGIVMAGRYNKVTRVNVHNHAERGILAAGDYSTVEDSVVWRNAFNNCRLSTCPATKYPKGGWGTGLSAARDNVDGITDNAILRRNVVFENWGEGLSTFEARGTILDSNVVYDNWALNLYVSDAANIMVSNNLLYQTPNNYVKRNPLNFGLCDETGLVASENITIVNNLIKGGAALLGWWVDGRTPNAKMKNFLIANNTFVHAQLADAWSGAIIFRDAAHVNVQFTNNLVDQDGVGVPIIVNQGDVRFASNLWTKTPTAKAKAWNDVYVADPQLTQAGSAASGQLVPDYFKLKNTSPAINEGSVISSILDDFFGNPREATPDIGAHEF